MLSEDMLPARHLGISLFCAPSAPSAAAFAASSNNFSLFSPLDPYKRAESAAIISGAPEAGPSSNGGSPPLPAAAAPAFSASQMENAGSAPSLGGRPSCVDAIRPAPSARIAFDSFAGPFLRRFIPEPKSDINSNVHPLWLQNSSNACL
jgi:hypothetical protein